jgi:hypothetical protein
MEPDRRIGDGEHRAFLLQISVRQPNGPHQLGSADLAPDEIMSVVHDTHLVGFRVADADLHLMVHGFHLVAGGPGGRAVVWRASGITDSTRGQTGEQSHFPILLSRSWAAGNLPPR